MREYPLFELGAANAYGEPGEAQQIGTVIAAVYTRQQRVADTALYLDCEYIALTEAELTDHNMLGFGGKLLKVMYVERHGRYAQAFLKLAGNNG